MLYAVAQRGFASHGCSVGGDLYSGAAFQGDGCHFAGRFRRVRSSALVCAKQQCPPAYAQSDLYSSFLGDRRALFCRAPAGVRTFVGGYDDSLFFIADIKHFALSWAHALRMVLIPINGELITSHSFLTRSWQILVLAIGVFSVITGISDKSSRLRLAFLLCWFACALCLSTRSLPLPMICKAAGWHTWRQHRFAWPLMLLMSAAPQMQGAGRIIGRLKAVATFVFLMLAGGLLFLNNLPWMLAGLESNRIRDGLESLYEELPGIRKFY